MDNAVKGNEGNLCAKKPSYLCDGIGGIIEGFALILQDDGRRNKDKRCEGQQLEEH